MAFYIEKAIFVNRAPFNHLELDFKERGINVLAAINGRGKTTILSHITDAFYELAKAAGLEVKYISGTADNGSGNGYQGHAWNQVKVDGQWYQVDVTWDDGYEHLTSKGYISEFFLITPDNMMYDHTYSNPDSIHY